MESNSLQVFVDRSSAGQESADSKWFRKDQQIPSDSNRRTNCFFFLFFIFTFPPHTQLILLCNNEKQKKRWKQTLGELVLQKKIYYEKKPWEWWAWVYGNKYRTVPHCRSPWLHRHFRPADGRTKLRCMAPPRYQIPSFFWCVSKKQKRWRDTYS